MTAPWSTQPLERAVEMKRIAESMRGMDVGSAATRRLDAMIEEIDRAIATWYWVNTEISVFIPSTETE